MSIDIVNLEKLKGHEEINPNHLSELMKEIKVDGILKKPIAVDKNTDVILDGAHRFNALKKLGYRKIPVKFVDYNSQSIRVQSWRNDGEIRKEDVIKAAITGKKLPPKTTKHMIQINGELQHISTIEEEVNVSLEELK